MSLVNRLFYGKWSRWALVTVLLVVMAAQLVWVSRASSATWDEPHHLYDGYTVWTRHSYTLNPEVPPLVKLVAALPLLGRRLAVPADHGWSVPREAFRDGREFVFGNGVGRTLEVGRLACMGFTLALGLLIYCMAAEMFGYGAGVFALALFVVDPNFLAHGALVTTDVGSACLFVAALYAFYRYCKRPTWTRLLLTGIAAGLLLATKFTGVFLAPMLVLLVLAEWAVVRNAKLLRERMVALVVVFAMAWVVLWAFYGFRYKAGVNGGDIDPPLSAYLARMYDRADAPRLALVAKYHLLPEAYLWGLENTKQTEFEDTSYLWGKVYRHGNWWYFPVALAVKSTLPFLLLLVLGVPAIVWGLRQRRRELAWLLLPAGLYFAVAMHSDFDIGVRHLLPVYALLYVLVAVWLLCWCREMRVGCMRC